MTGEPATQIFWATKDWLLNQWNERWHDAWYSYIYRQGAMRWSQNIAGWRALQGGPNSFTPFVAHFGGIRIWSLELIDLMDQWQTDNIIVIVIMPRKPVLLTFVVMRLKLVSFGGV